MYYSPYDDFISNAIRAPQPNSYVRFFNASPNSPALDVYANDTLIAKNLNYKQLTQYVPAPVGNYIIKVYPAGKDTTPVLTSEVYIPPNTIFNLAIVDKYPNLSLYTIPEPVSAQSFGRPCIRFINLSPDSPEIDVLLSNGTKIFNSVGYKFITDYACIPSGSYSFGIAPAKTTNPVISASNVSLNPNSYYTIYALGESPKNFPTEVIMVPEPR